MFKILNDNNVNLPVRPSGPRELTCTAITPLAVNGDQPTHAGNMLLGNFLTRQKLPADEEHHPDDAEYHERQENETDSRAKEHEERVTAGWNFLRGS